MKKYAFLIIALCGLSAFVFADRGHGGGGGHYSGGGGHYSSHSGGGDWHGGHGDWHGGHGGYWGGTGFGLGIGFYPYHQYYSSPGWNYNTYPSGSSTIYTWSHPNYGSSYYYTDAYGNIYLWNPNIGAWVLVR